MSAPPAPRRYRCTACGNLTRFEVTVTRRTRSFHHYTVGGELSIEDTELLSEDIESVLCRWCGTASSVVEIDADQGVAGQGDADQGDADQGDAGQTDAGATSDVDAAPDSIGATPGV